MKLVAPNGAAVEASEQAVPSLLAAGFRKAKEDKKPVQRRAAKSKG